MLFLRLIHLFEANEDPIYSQNVTVDLDSLFSCCTVTNVQEVRTSTRAGASKNQLLVPSVPGHLWFSNRWCRGVALVCSQVSLTGNQVIDANPSHKVVLEPIQIRSFAVKLNAAARNTFRPKH